MNLQQKALFEIFERMEVGLEILDDNWARVLSASSRNLIHYTCIGWWEKRTKSGHNFPMPLAFFRTNDAVFCKCCKTQAPNNIVMIANLRSL